MSLNPTELPYSLQQEFNLPRTPWGKRYMILLMAAIVGAIFFIFVAKEYPLMFPLGSLQLLLVEHDLADFRY